MENERTTVTATPISIGVPLRMVWASKIVSDLWNLPDARVGSKVDLDDELIALFQTVTNAGWSSKYAKVDLIERTLTLTDGKAD